MTMIIFQKTVSAISKKEPYMLKFLDLLFKKNVKILI